MPDRRRRDRGFQQVVCEFVELIAVGVLRVQVDGNRGGQAGDRGRGGVNRRGDRTGELLALGHLLSAELPDPLLPGSREGFKARRDLSDACGGCRAAGEGQLDDVGEVLLEMRDEEIDVRIADRTVGAPIFAESVPGPRRRIGLPGGGNRGTPGLPLTTWDSVILGRSIRMSGWSRYRPEDEAAAEDAMQRAGVAHLAQRSVDTLSGGERQRVLIARAITQGASHLLLDEPTNHLDIRYQHEILALVHSLPLTTLVVLHDLNLAARYCDELVLLDKGRVVAIGTPGEILQPDLIASTYGIGARRADTEGVPQLTFFPLPDAAHAGR